MNRYSLLAFVVLAVSTVGTAAAATIKITNNISPIQLGATIYDNGGNSGNPTINIWAPSSDGGGNTVQPSGSYTYSANVANGSAAEFGIQLNSARIPSGGGQCDQLCSHAKVAISSDGSTCSVSQGQGTCGANPQSPRWSVSAQNNIPITNGVCEVQLTKAKIPSPVVCGCEKGGYPCATKVVCGPGTPAPKCPAKPPYTW